MRFTASGVFLLDFYSVQNRELENVILTLSLCPLFALNRPPTPIQACLLSAGPDMPMNKQGAGRRRLEKVSSTV